MSDPFEFINPADKFREASEQGGPEEPDAARHSRLPKTSAWVAGAAVIAIGASVVFDLHTQGDHQLATDRQAPIPARAASTHAFDPAAPADPVSTGSVEASAPPMANNDQSANVNPEQPGHLTAETPGEDAQWVKTSLAATLHSGPSVSTPILTYYPVGAELRTTGQQSGWVRTVDPATSQQGWIYGIYLSPSQHAGHDASQQQPPKVEAEADLDAPDAPQISAPDPSASQARSPRNYDGRHRTRGTLVIRFGFGHFRVRL